MKFRRAAATIKGSLAALFLAAACEAAPIDVYVLAGQSNAAGGANIRELPDHEAALAMPQESIFQYQMNDTESSDWEPLAPRQGGNIINAYFGAELSFAQAMQRRTGEPIAIIKVAYNGTSLATQWLPSLDLLYDLMIEKVTASLGQLEALDYQPNLAGFIWIQHEGDAGVLSRAEAYDDNLLALASAVRLDLDAPNLPVLFNEAHTLLAREYVSVLRQSQHNATAEENMLMVNADDLILKSDSVHFTTAMHVELGRRFADLVHPSADFNNDAITDGNDLASWRTSFGIDRVADGNADGLTDGTDFLMWQRQLSGSPATAAVPEPGTWVLAATALMVGIRLRRMKTPPLELTIS